MTIPLRGQADLSPLLKLSEVFPRGAPALQLGTIPDSLSLADAREVLQRAFHQQHVPPAVAPGQHLCLRAPGVKRTIFFLP